MSLLFLFQCVVLALRANSLCVFVSVCSKLYGVLLLFFAEFACGGRDHDLQLWDVATSALTFRYVHDVIAGYLSFGPIGKKNCDLSVREKDWRCRARGANAT